MACYLVSRVVELAGRASTDLRRDIRQQEYLAHSFLIDLGVWSCHREWLILCEHWVRAITWAVPWGTLQVDFLRDARVKCSAVYGRGVGQWERKYKIKAHLCWMPESRIIRSSMRFANQEIRHRPYSKYKFKGQKRNHMIQHAIGTRKFDLLKYPPLCGPDNGFWAGPQFFEIVPEVFRRDLGNSKKNNLHIIFSCFHNDRLWYILLTQSVTCSTIW